MDGVIVDSMPYHVRAWQKALKPFGLKLSDYEVYKREGENWKKSTRDFLTMTNFKPTPALREKVFKKRTEIFKDIFRPRLFPYSKSILNKLCNKKLKIALVTATPRSDVNRMLPADIFKLFTAIVCGNDTRRGKPHPDPYLKALQKLKLTKKEVMVVENAPYGVASAKAAGLYCVALETSLPKRFLKQADIILPSIKGLVKYLHRMLKL